MNTKQIVEMILALLVILIFGWWIAQQGISAEDKKAIELYNNDKAYMEWREKAIQEIESNSKLHDELEQQQSELHERNIYLRATIEQKD